MVMVKDRSLATVTGGRRRRRHRLRNRKGNPAAALEASDYDLKRNQAASASEGGEILKRKKEIFALIPPRHVLLGTELTEEEANRLVARETRRKKVVKTRVPQERIDYMKETPDPIISIEIPDDELAKRSEFFRNFYAEKKAMNDKVKAYHQAILDRYDARGYAEDESETTDSEEEMVEN